MAKPASFLRYSVPLASLALLCASQPAFAQAKAVQSTTKAESEEAVFIPIEYRPPPYQVSIGVRLTGKAKVKFSGLGSVPSSTSAGPNPNATNAEKDTEAYKKQVADAAKYGRTYDDGMIAPDYTRSINADGTGYTQVPPTDGKTNYWAFTSANQVVDLPTGGKALALHSYAVESAGGTAEAAKNSSLAWDIEISRELGSNRRMSWGLLLGAGISDINCKTSTTVKAKLRTLTDYYSLEGLTLPTSAATGAVIPVSYQGREEYYPYTYLMADDGINYATDAYGNRIPVYQYDPTTGKKIKVWSDEVPRISTDPIAGSRTDVTEENASLDVVGNWQVKGAYLTARFGPYFTFQLARRLALRASAGLTFTVVGTTLRFSERIYVPAKAAYMEINNADFSRDPKKGGAYTTDPRVSGILGYFVSCELDAFLTDRTGVFVGASHEDFQRDISMQYYTQQADLSLSSGTVIRTGITTRF